VVVEQQVKTILEFIRYVFPKALSFGEVRTPDSSWVIERGGASFEQNTPLLMSLCHGVL
jgi:hypothetical protein